MVSVDVPRAGGERAALTMLAVAVGNTRVRLGVFRGPDLEASGVASPGGVAEAVRALGSPEVAAVVVASVNEANAAGAEAEIRGEVPGAGVYRIGRDVPIPLSHRLEDASTVGHDRLLTAVAAYARCRQACMVVDVGTAVTVDFVDGEGAFCGGAIAPGLGMMLRAMNAGAAQLPDVAFELPDPARGAFGLDTAHAMRLGVSHAVRGFVRSCLDSYAEAYGGYPQVIGTGGDVGVLEADGLVEHVVPDLQLLGIQHCAQAALDDEG